MKIPKILESTYTHNYIIKNNNINIGADVFEKNMYNETSLVLSKKFHGDDHPLTKYIKELEILLTIPSIHIQPLFENNKHFAIKDSNNIFIINNNNDDDSITYAYNMNNKAWDNIEGNNKYSNINNQIIESLSETLTGVKPFYNINNEVDLTWTHSISPFRPYGSINLPLEDDEKYNHLNILSSLSHRNILYGRSIIAIGKLIELSTSFSSLVNNLIHLVNIIDNNNYGHVDVDNDKIYETINNGALNKIKEILPNECISKVTSVNNFLQNNRKLRLNLVNLYLNGSENVKSITDILIKIEEINVKTNYNIILIENCISNTLGNCSIVEVSNYKDSKLSYNKLVNMAIGEGIRSNDKVSFSYYNKIYFVVGFLILLVVSVLVLKYSHRRLEMRAKKIN